jgi:hypothetical protein
MYFDIILSNLTGAHQDASMHNLNNDKKKDNSKVITATLFTLAFFVLAGVIVTQTVRINHKM